MRISYIRPIVLSLALLAGGIALWHFNRSSNAGKKADNASVSYARRPDTGVDSRKARDKIREVRDLLNRDAGTSALNPSPPPPRNFVEFQRLAQLAGENTISFSDAQAERVSLTQDSNASPLTCLEVSLGSGRVGYLDAWLSQLVVDDVLSGVAPDTLQSIYPVPLRNGYWDVVDVESQVSLGKHSLQYHPDGLGFIYNFVWNNGVEESYLVRDNALFLVDASTLAAASAPTWLVTTESQGDFYRQEIKLFGDSSVSFELRSHIGSYDFFFRLQESCEKGANMLPQFVKVTQETFSAFVQTAFGGS